MSETAALQEATVGGGRVSAMAGGVREREPARESARVRERDRGKQRKRASERASEREHAYQRWQVAHVRWWWGGSVCVHVCLCVCVHVCVRKSARARERPAWSVTLRRDGAEDARLQF